PYLISFLTPCRQKKTPNHAKSMTWLGNRKNYTIIFPNSVLLPERLALILTPCTFGTHFMSFSRATSVHSPRHNMTPESVTPSASIILLFSYELPLSV